MGQEGKDGGGQSQGLVLKWTNGLSVSALTMEELGNQPIEAVQVCREAADCNGVAHRIY